MLELAFFDLGFVVAANCGQAAVQRFLLHFQHLHWHAGVQEVHGNAAAHGAGANNGHALDVAQRCVCGHVRNLGRSTLAQEQVAQGAAFAGEHEVHENFTLGGHADGKFFLGSSLDCCHALERCGKVLGHAAHHIAGKLEVSVAQGVLAGKLADDGHGAGRSDRARKGQRLFGQRLRRGGNLLEQLLARQHGQHFGLDGLAADDHIERGLYAQNTRQALRAASARDEPELDFGQRNAGAGCSDAVMATQCQLQTAAHGHGVHGGDHRLGGLFQH